MMMEEKKLKVCASDRVRKEMEEPRDDWIEWRKVSYLLKKGARKR